MSFKSVYGELKKRGLESLNAVNPQAVALRENLEFLNSFFKELRLCGLPYGELSSVKGRVENGLKDLRSVKVEEAVLFSSLKRELERLSSQDYPKGPGSFFDRAFLKVVPLGLVASVLPYALFYYGQVWAALTVPLLFLVLSYWYRFLLYGGLFGLLFTLLQLFSHKLLLPPLPYVLLSLAYLLFCAYLWARREARAAAYLDRALKVYRWFKGGLT